MQVPDVFSQDGQFIVGDQIQFVDDQDIGQSHLSAKQRQNSQFYDVYRTDRTRVSRAKSIIRGERVLGKTDDLLYFHWANNINQTLDVCKH